MFFTISLPNYASRIPAIHKISILISTPKSAMINCSLPHTHPSTHEYQQQTSKKSSNTKYAKYAHNLNVYTYTRTLNMVNTCICTSWELPSLCTIIIRIISNLRPFSSRPDGKKCSLLIGQKCTRTRTSLSV